MSPPPAVMEDLYHYTHPITKQPSPMISKETYDIIMKHAEVIIFPIPSYAMMCELSVHFPSG